MIDERDPRSEGDNPPQGHTPQHGQPLSAARRRTPPASPAVQAWLDGEVPREPTANPDDRENVELWNKINTEAEQLRRRTTPMHVQKRIMDSLPDETPKPTPIAPQRQVFAGEGTPRTRSPLLYAVIVLIVVAIIAALIL